MTVVYAETVLHVKKSKGCRDPVPKQKLWYCAGLAQLTMPKFGSILIRSVGVTRIRIFCRVNIYWSLFGLWISIFLVLRYMDKTEQE